MLGLRFPTPNVHVCPSQGRIGIFLLPHFTLTRLTWWLALHLGTYITYLGTLILHVQISAWGEIARGLAAGRYRYIFRTYYSN